MKNPKTIKGLLGSLSRGTLVNANQVKNIFNKAEVNVLELTSKELKSLNDIISADLKSTSESTRISATNLQSFVSSGTQTTGGFLLPPAKYTQIASIAKIIGKTKDNNYNLGYSDIGSLAQTLGIILEEYRQDGHSLTVEQEHTVKAGIIGAQKIQRMDEKTLSILSSIKKENSDVLLRALQGSGKGLEVDLLASIDFARNVKAGEISIKYTIQDRSATKTKSELSSILSSNIRKYLTDLSRKDSDATIKRLNSIFGTLKDPFNIKPSPTYIDRAEELIDNIVKGKNTPNKRARTTVQLKKTIPSQGRAEAKKIATIIRKQTKDLITKIAAVKRKKRFLIPTVTLKAIINKSLDTAIKGDMESSSSPSSKNYLRYQQGNFSKSAKILTLNRQQTGAYIGTYTYAKDPYSVFEPGRRMGSPGRDPRRYIEESARDIAKQVLKKHFVGLVLETR